MKTVQIQAKPRISIVLHFIVSLSIYLLLCLTIYSTESYLLHFIMSIVFLCISSSYLYLNVLKFYFPFGSFQKFILIVLVPVLIGAIHYLLFINPEYFQKVDKLYEHSEYQYCVRMMEYTAEKWRQNGLFSRLDSWYTTEVKSGALYSYMGLQFFFSSSKYLGVCTFNTLHTLFCASCVLTMADIAGVKDYSSYKRIFCYVMLMPLLIISSYSYRDIVGISLVSIGILIMVCTSSSMASNLLALPFSCGLCLLFRTQYIIVPLFLFVYYYSIRNKKTIVIILAYLLWASFAGATLWFLIVSDKDLTGYLNLSIGSIVFGPVLALVGEFPWSNILYTKFWQYLPFHYLQAALNIVVWITVITRIIFLGIKPKRMDYIIVSIVFFSMTAFNFYRHISYASVGTVFLYPFVFDSKTISRKSSFSVGMKIAAVVLILLFLSMIYTMLGFRGSGMLSSISR